MSKINIDRIIKDIKSKTTSLTPVIEAVCNSIDAIGTERTDGVIDIIVKRTGQRSLNLDNTNTLSDIVSIDIIDNGIGFTEENKDSFDTYRSGFKMSKGGKGFGQVLNLFLLKSALVILLGVGDIKCYYIIHKADILHVTNNIVYRKKAII